MANQAAGTQVPESTEKTTSTVEPASQARDLQTKKSAFSAKLGDRALTASLVTGLIVVLILIWALISRLGIVPAYLLPTPSMTASAVWSDATNFDGFWVKHFFQTFKVIVLGFGLAAIAGLIIGPLIIIHPMVERAVYPIVVAFQTVPKIALAPLLLVWLGYGDVSKVTIAALVAFFPVVVNVIAGLKAGDQRQLLLMQSLRASWWTRMKKVRIPNALPYVFAGLDVAVVFAVIGAIVAEFLGSSSGLGSLVIIRQTSVQIAGLFSVLFFLAALGYVLHVIIVQVGKKMTFWALTDDSRSKP